ncbi:MAG: sulfotransferase [bacterium]
MKLKAIKVNDFYALIKYGISKRKGTIYSLRNDEFKTLSPPVFFLSTGRTGTKWFADLLKHAKGSLVFHAPVPDLSVQSVFAYNIFKKNNFELTGEQETALKEIFLAAREEQLRYAYKTEKKYIETNNYLTFFAPVLAKLFPNAKFVHLHRHPGEFIRSAMDRNYFAGTDTNLIRRIRPSSGDYYQEWQKFSQLEKSAWLWFETNNFIDTLKNKLESDRIMTLSLNKFNLDNVKKVIEFLEIDIQESVIRKKLRRKKNIQKSRATVPYSKWSDIQKKELIDICGKQAQFYGYEL